MSSHNHFILTLYQKNVNDLQSNSDESVSPTHSLDSSTKHGRTLVIVIAVIVAFILFAILAPVVPTTAPGGSTGSHVAIHASISYMFNEYSGTTYTHTYGWVWGPPPFP
jgi:hypothetical protein